MPAAKEGLPSKDSVLSHLERLLHQQELLTRSVTYIRLIITPHYSLNRLISMEFIERQKIMQENYTFSLDLMQVIFYLSGRSRYSGNLHFE